MASNSVRPVTTGPSKATWALTASVTAWARAAEREDPTLSSSVKPPLRTTGSFWTVGASASRYPASYPRASFWVTVSAVDVGRAIVGFTSWRRGPG